MRITFDQQADAAYIYLGGETHPGGAGKTVTVDPIEVDGMINLDLDKKGLLLGIEILDATRLLSPEVLRSAEQL